MKLILLVGSGSFIGGVLRYLLSRFIQTGTASAFPYGTLWVNLIGCLFIGVVFGLSEKTNMPEEWKLFLAMGLLGGFTTFSAFSLETVNLFRNGQLWLAAVYITASLLLGLLATFTGLSLARLCLKA
jgi:CrcB protein